MEFTRRSTPVRLLFAVLVTLLLFVTAGCGGGSDPIVASDPPAANPPAAPPPSTTPPATTPPPTTTPPTGGGGSTPAVNEFLYVGAQFDAQKVYGFRIDTATGALAQVPGSPWATPHWVGELVGDRTSPHFFTLVYGPAGSSFGRGFLPFTIDASGSATLGQIIETSGQASVLSPDGRFLYSVGPVRTGYSLITYQVNANGTLTRLSEQAAPNQTAGIAMHPSGTQLVISTNVSNEGHAALFAFSRNTETGAVAATGTNISFPGASGLYSLRFTPNGQYLYATDSVSTSNVIYAVAMGANGAMAPVAGSPYPAGVTTPNITVHPGGSLLLAAGREAVTVHRIGANGALTLVLTQPLARVGHSQPAFDTTGTFVYFPRFDQVEAFRIDTATGALTPVPGSPFVAQGALNSPVIKRR